MEGSSRSATGGPTLRWSAAPSSCGTGSPSGSANRASISVSPRYSFYRVECRNVNSCVERVLHWDACIPPREACIVAWEGSPQQEGHLFQLLSFWFDLPTSNTGREEKEAQESWVALTCRSERPGWLAAVLHPRPRHHLRHQLRGWEVRIPG